MKTYCDWFVTIVLISLKESAGESIKVYTNEVF